MNKTININLGGYFFHIDEIAYQKLKRYLDAVSRSLNDDPQGKNEILSDIEARISELLSEKIKDVRQVVNENDIDEVIAIMGQPEDYVEAEEGYTEASSESYQRKKTSRKKLFRDGDDKFLGGVCSGIGHYIGIDAIWIRLAFIILVASGFSPIAYILLWILLPEAKTTAEKLQMEGEPVNINNIEKKIRTEFETLTSKLKGGANDISEKFSSADYDKLKSQTKSGLQDFLDTIGKILGVLFKILGKFMGGILIFVAGITIISLIFGLFSFGSLEFLNFDDGIVSYPPFFYGSTLPNWLLTIFLFLASIIPFIALFVVGLRILSPNVKKLNTATSLTLLGVWLVSVFGISFAGIEHGVSSAYDGTKISQKSINYDNSKPLKISIKNNNDVFYIENLRHRDNNEEVFIDDKKMKYSNNIKVSVKKSETENAYIKIKKDSEGKRRKNANENADKIRYNFTINDNRLIFDAYFLSDFKNMWKDEDVRLTLYIPEGTTIFFDNSSKRFLSDIDNIQDIYRSGMANHHFEMTVNGLNCTDCTKPEQNWNEETTTKKQIEKTI